MSYEIVHVPQRSEAWLKLRLGRLTSSKADAMLATRKDGKEAAGRRNLLIALALERLTGRPQERAFQSPAMQHGAEKESEARAAYEALTGHFIE
jgi:hypothetical protein